MEHDEFISSYTFLGYPVNRHLNENKWLGYIYVAAFLKSNEMKYKIGYTYNIDTRDKQLNTEIGVNIIYVWCVPNPQPIESIIKNKLYYFIRKKKNEEESEEDSEEEEDTTKYRTETIFDIPFDVLTRFISLYIYYALSKTNYIKNGKKKEINKFFDGPAFIGISYNGTIYYQTNHPEEDDLVKDTRVEVLWGEENREDFKKYVGKRFSGKILGKGTSKKFIEKSWKIEWDDTDMGKTTEIPLSWISLPEYTRGIDTSRVVVLEEVYTAIGINPITKIKEENNINFKF